MLFICSFKSVNNHIIQNYFYTISNRKTKDWIKMSYFKIDQEELLREIESNPGAAVAKQTRIPAAATETILRLSNKVHGIFDLQHQLEFSTEIVNALRYIREHDYLAFLVIIDSYDLIRKFFWENDLFKRQLAVIEELEKEKEERQGQQNYISAQEQSLINKQQRDKLNFEQKQIEDKAILNASLYQYFNYLEQQIYERFYTKQIEVFTRAYEGQISRMDRAIEIVNNDPAIPSEDKIAFLQMREDYRQEIESVKNINIYNADRSINPQALKRKYEEEKRVYEKFSDLFVKKLEQYPNNQILQGIRQEQIAANISTKAELTQNEEVLNQELSENNKNKEPLKEAVKEDIQRSMGNITSYLAKTSLDTLSENDRNLFKNTIQKLGEYESKLNLINDDREIKNLSQQFLNETIKIKDIVTPPVLKNDIYQKLEFEINKLNKLQVILKNPANLLENPSAPAVAILIQEEIKPAPLEKAAINPTLALKDKLSFFRPQEEQEKIEIDSKLAQDDSKKMVDVERIKELNEETQADLEGFFESLSTEINEISENDNFSEEENPLVSQLKKQCEEISPTIKQQVDISKLESLRDTLGALKKNHPELNKIMCNLETIINSMDSSPSLRR